MASPVGAVTNWYAQAAGAGSSSASTGSSVVANAAGEIIQGALSIPPLAFGAGVKLGQSVLDGMLSVFGETGAAISRFSHTLTESVSNIFQHSAQGISSILKGILGIAGAGLGIAGAVAGGLAGAAVGAGAVGIAGAGALAAPGVGLAAAPAILALGPQAVVIGAVIGAGLVAGIMGAVKHLADAVSGALGAVVSIFGEIGKVGTQAAQSILDVLKDVMNTALSQSRSILDLSQQSGLSIQNASRAFTTARAFGVDPSQLSNQNVFFQRMANLVSGITGAPGSPENIASFRSRYRGMAGIGEDGQPSSPFALMMAQNMAARTGMQAFIPAAMLPDRQFNRQLEATRGLEMPASVVTKFQQDFAGLLNIVSVFADNVKTTLGAALLPAATAGLNAVIGYWKANQQVIVDSLFAIGRFVYADLPGMVLVGLSSMVEGAVSFAKGLGGVLETLGGYAHGIASFIRAFQAGDATFLDAIGNFLGGVDSFINSFGAIAATFDGIKAIFHNVFSGIGDMMVQFANGLGSLFNGLKHTFDPLNLLKLPDFTPFARTFKMEDPLAAYTARVGTGSHLQDMFNSLRTNATVGQGADLLDKAGTWLEKQGAQAGDAAEKAAAPLLNYLAGAQKALGTPEQRGKDYDMLTRLDKIAQNTGATANNTKATVESMGCMREGILLEAANNVEADAVQGIVGIGGYAGG